MTNERAKRFPLGLEDLVREPRRPEGRPGEIRAAAFAASAALNARKPSAKNASSASSVKGAHTKPVQAKPVQARTPEAQAPAQAKSEVKAQARPPAQPQARGPAHTAVKPQSKPQLQSQPKPLAKAAAQILAPRTAPNGAPSSKPAAKLSDRAAAPSVALNGALALTSERVRERMVERLRANGVTHPRVLNAMSVVPRHMFVDPGLAAQAYEDAALPIGHHQTISKPSVVARMIELAAAGRALNNVLEIGTGCGYQAAVLSQVAREVYSIERIKPLSERAKINLRPLRIPNIRLHYGDGRLGLPSAAPFDAIVIAAAGLDVPQALLEQLAIGGRLVAPVGSQEGHSQVLTLVERLGPAQWRESRLDRVFFVPLKSGVI
ncbi:protein-L-isoaspartate(D-aspartate) O-methyltransferase [Paraburkholderia sp. DD10]|jgi:protein-L-isoaspartate(D-aspartate) O-methyltransferase|uniref:Protein-L-isoaspartate O-methyltransferase n=1 Tax=Paraburkholderia terricola TaxID=169427 RepID=A0A1M6ISN6_9BURK|nr:MULTISPECIES: protein-L-isoaspartate(D-aspartate) O-methyltransferase [Paraburkholderia]MDR6490940.1 protein-L-isoaspartate(D-aspartate) O-methyltransferase [Paraburkholderia terricola]SDN51996.1 protein-L-isoaspartate(D-aspartate) O-methyltransferase [Paraburkholderia sediminicola]SHJ37493.1 protein-L-isoaspartate(D-aspartate) O-methyltransferase [Paraburkholderia terricola]